MKVYIVCMCHPISVILSFDVKSKISADMLLPVILSELVYLRFLFPISSTSSSASLYSSPSCSRHLDKWLESSSLLFKLISI